MMRPPLNTKRAHLLLRSYILNVLSSRKRANVERFLAESAEWREALHEEREALKEEGGFPLDESASEFEKLMARSAALERKRSTARRRRRRVLEYTFAAIVAGLMILFLTVAILETNAYQRQSNVARHLGRLGHAFRMYAKDNPGMLYPPITRYGGLWMVDIERMYPKYLTNLSLFVDPNLPNRDELRTRMQALAEERPLNWEAITRLAAESYVYPGWVVQSDADALELKAARAKLTPEDYEGEMPDYLDGKCRLREGASRFIITDINNPAASAMGATETPVMFENVSTLSRRGKPKGCTVVYLDGYVEFVPYGHRFPATAAAAEAFRPPED